MAKPREFSLDSVRTDGWFERIGEGIGSFQSLCEIVGDAFFAFSMITGARITALTVDRRSPDNTIVDFVVAADDEAEASEVQRLTLADFRQRLVGVLLSEEPSAPAPRDEKNLEGLQQHIGVRFLLLAPLYGYSLRRLVVEGGMSRLSVLYNGVEEIYELAEFQARIRSLVREELDRAQAGSRSAIDLSKVAEAQMAFDKADYGKVIQLLGSWPAPLAIFLRTPEGQMLTLEARALIAKGLGYLGSACARLGEAHQGEEVLRLAAQYAQDGASASDIYHRLGRAMLDGGRAGEAIGPLRRAVALGASPRDIWPLLTRAFTLRNKFVAALACLREARTAGVADAELTSEIRHIEERLGPHLTAWQSVVFGENRGPV